MKSAPRSRRGMVLFEVIIALTIFTLVTFSLVMALHASMTIALQRNQVDAAIIGMQNQMALAAGTRLLPGEKDLPDDGSGITYQVLIEQAQLQDQNLHALNNIFRVTLTAKWKVDGDEETRSVSELVYQP